MQTETLDLATRLARLRKVVYWGAVILSAKVFLAILYEYQWYFPADFDASAFLSGRRYSFTGFYQNAFYVHVIASPIALLMGTFLFFSGGKHHLAMWHRIAGKLQATNVLILVVPSGIIMALDAYGGVPTAVAFLLWSMATGVTMLVAVWYASERKIALHQKWATRCFLLLWSPLLLRLIAGVTIVTGIESELTYRANAWISLVLPLLIYEVRTRTTLLHVQ